MQKYVTDCKGELKTRYWKLKVLLAFLLYFVVRLCEDKLTLVRQVLQSSTTAYKKKQKVNFFSLIS